MTRKISVLGGGSFGTVLANVMAENGHAVTLWVRSQEVAAEINARHENARYLPAYELAHNLVATHELESAICDAEVVFVCVPSKSYREVVRKITPLLKGDTVLVSTTKGIEAGSYALMSEILIKETGSEWVGVLSGPNLAKELAEKKLTGTVIASASERVCNLVHEVLACRYFRVYSNSDRFGVELAGALKNIYAVASGMADALGMGVNTKSMLLTRSLAEMSRLGDRLGANPATFLGLAGVGDLVATCTSPLSRNYRVGYALGQGKTLAEALAELEQVVEGVHTIEITKEKADSLGVYMPLVSQLYSILYEGSPLDASITGLMLGGKTSDVEFVAS